MDRGDCRTAPATPGLLKNAHIVKRKVLEEEFSREFDVDRIFHGCKNSHICRAKVTLSGQTYDITISVTC